MKKFLALSNAAVIILMLIWNIYSASNVMNGTTIAAISDKFNSLFTPAGYAFSIWSAIYIGQIILAYFTVKQVYSSEINTKYIYTLAPLLITTNLLNCSWIYIWLHEYFLFSVLVMIGMLIGLIILMINIRFLDKENNSDFRYFIALPISSYTAWISVATIANISEYLQSIGWNFLFSESTWAIIIILIAGLINAYLVYKRNLFVFGAIGIWSIFAIFIKHYGVYTNIVIASLLSIMIMGISIAITLWKKKSVE